MQIQPVSPTIPIEIRQEECEVAIIGSSNATLSLIKNDGKHSPFVDLEVTFYSGTYIQIITDIIVLLSSFASDHCDLKSEKILRMVAFLIECLIETVTVFLINPKSASSVD